MLSYRHAFHAGNAADVLKHSVLVFCLEYLLRKERPLLCVDTHAGAGRYATTENGIGQSCCAAQHAEWETGIGKLLRHRAAAGSVLPSMLHRYIVICCMENCGTEHTSAADPVPAYYPGSPLLISRLLRPADRLVCFELHPADYEACKAALPNGTELRRADGFSGLKSLLPPLSRRGLVFIDPSYEVKDDYIRLPETLATALKRFAAGTYIIWYPLLRNPPSEHAAALPNRLMELYPGNRCQINFYTANPTAPPANSPRGMYGSGMVIFNPPWTLKAALEESLPLLAAIMGTGRGGWEMETKG